MGAALCNRFNNLRKARILRGVQITSLQECRTFCDVFSMSCGYSLSESIVLGLGDLADQHMLSFTLWIKPRDQLRHLKIIAVKAEFPLIYIVQFALPTTIARGDFANYRNEIRFITIKSGAIAALNGCCPMPG